MARRAKLGIGLLFVATLLVSIVAVLWWRRQHTFSGPRFDAPAVAASLPAAGLRLMPVVVGVDRPTDIRFVPGGGTRAVILEQGGKARLVDIGPALAGGAAADMKAAPLVLDIWVRAVAETGLLSLAFHPHYAERGTFYVYYHPWLHNQARSRVAEFKLPLSEIGKHPAVEARTLVDVDQQMSVHQGGGLAFGPDGKLYVGFGDGGVANDPDGNAQSMNTLKGKVVRLDVDGSSLVPKDNPFVSRAGARPEIWALGLRNPWRLSFDSAGHLIVGDVGQEAREELDLVGAGANLGWNQREGKLCSQTSPQCQSEGMTDPIFDYDRVTGTSVTAGFEMTGTRVPQLTGKYLFADFVRGRIWSMRLPTSAPKAGAPTSDVSLELLGQWPRLFSSFGRDAAGNLYVTDMANGEVLALMPSK